MQNFGYGKLSPANIPQTVDLADLDFAFDLVRTLGEFLQQPRFFLFGHWGGAGNIWMHQFGNVDEEPGIIRANSPISREHNEGAGIESPVDVRPDQCPGLAIERFDVPFTLVAGICESNFGDPAF